MTMNFEVNVFEIIDARSFHLDILVHKLVDVDQFELENECAVSWNVASGSAFSVASFGRDIDFPFFSDVHIDECHLPTGDEFIDTKHGRCSASSSRRVKLFAVDEFSVIVNGDDASWLRCGL